MFLVATVKDEAQREVIVGCVGTRNPSSEMEPIVKKHKLLSDTLEVMVGEFVVIAIKTQ